MYLKSLHVTGWYLTAYNYHSTKYICLNFLVPPKPPGRQLDEVLKSGESTHVIVHAV